MDLYNLRYYYINYHLPFLHKKFHSNNSKNLVFYLEFINQIIKAFYFILIY